jgi:hypothetical protein
LRYYIDKPIFGQTNIFFNIMPPSGYIITEANNIGQFLLSNLSRLTQEAEIYDETPKQALVRELQNIAIISQNATPSQNLIVQLSGQMYSRIMENTPTDWKTFKMIGEKAITEISQEILSVKLV